ncbi:MAG TPA: hypothetical protein VF550_17955 [Polyangia bacterium]
MDLPSLGQTGLDRRLERWRSPAAIIEGRVPEFVERAVQWDEPLAQDRNHQLFLLDPKRIPQFPRTKMVWMVFNRVSRSSSDRGASKTMRPTSLRGLPGVSSRAASSAGITRPPSGVAALRRVLSTTAASALVAAISATVLLSGDQSMIAVLTL